MPEALGAIRLEATTAGGTAGATDRRAESAEEIIIVEINYAIAIGVSGAGGDYPDMIVEMLLEISVRRKQAERRGAISIGGH